MRTAESAETAGRGRGITVAVHAACFPRTVQRTLMDPLFVASGQSGRRRVPCLAPGKGSRVLECPCGLLQNLGTFIPEGTPTVP